MPRLSIRAVLRDIKSTKEAISRRNSTESKREALPSEGPTVVMVHGHRGHPADLDFLAQDAWGQGMSVIRPLRGDEVPITEAVESLLETLERNGGAHLVGHSLGGVIVALAAVARPDLTLSLTTISAPWAGAPLARLAGAGSVTSELAPKAWPAAVLTDSSKVLEDVRVLRVGAASDLLVPVRSATEAGAHPTHEKVVVKEGHSSILQNAAVREAVKAVRTGF